MAFPRDVEKTRLPAGQAGLTFVDSSLRPGPLVSEKLSMEFTRPSFDSGFDTDLPPSPTFSEDEINREKAQRRQSALSIKSRMSSAHEALFVLVVSSAQLLTQAGMAQSMAPLQIMAKDFDDPSPGQLSWFTAAYSLTVGTFILIAGRLGDMYGHKRMFVIGWFWYSVWSLISGLTVYTHSQIFFDTCRALQGIGPAILLPSSLAILGQTYPPGRRKEMVFSIYAATAPNGFIVGALFSSIFAQYVWWPWTYWAGAAACLIYGVLAVFVVPSEIDIKESYEKQTFDYLGTIVGVVGLVLFNVAWNQAPVVGWGEPYVIILLVLGVLFFVAFLWVEKKVLQPLVPIGGLDKTCAFVLACMVFGWASFGIWIYYFWQFMILLEHVTPLNVVAQNVPCGVSGACAALTVGFLLSRVRTPWLMLGAMCAFCLGNTIMSFLPVGRLYWYQAFWSVVVTPWGMDMSFPAATIILSNQVPKQHQGVAASLITTVVNYSISWGLGIAGTVEVHVNKGGADELAGYRGAWYSGMGLSGVGIIIAAAFLINSYRSSAKK
ncbi:hypothetical protein UCRNP2_5054 [Neofusicoccum parvum UCRNP2]|uniref:Major facilitator superfamily (MFS) profile domain-containing protein n=1 Tax=Botryosphaeria parva (strain UCR-NP2) TaxID=1287680 RepID=R1EKW6_BOTPV|nr:hypothetical protein UCRNP2_5054 [Neofusicoccum parvum UCRNP2]